MAILIERISRDVSYDAGDNEKRAKIKLSETRRKRA
jgi:hypothetical protein